MSLSQVTWQSYKGGEEYTFPDLRSARRHIEDAHPGGDWPQPALSDEVSPESVQLLLGSYLRSALIKCWRHAQFDRLMCGHINHLPEEASNGLERVTAEAILSAITSSTISGWKMEAGVVESRKGYFDHAWLRHDDGQILDIMADRFGGDPIQLHEPSSEAQIAYGPRPYTSQEPNEKWVAVLEEKLLLYVDVTKKYAKNEQDFTV